METEPSLKPCATCPAEVKQLRDGMCQPCYRRKRRNGTTEQRKPKTPMSWQAVDENTTRDSEAGCLIWKGNVDKDGFPRYYDSARYAAGNNNVLVYVRRWVLEQEGHEMGRRYIAEDICGNRLCVEKTHLVRATYTNSKSMLAAINARKTECVNGHPFTTENTYIDPSSGRRRCKQCAWASQKRHLGLNPDTLVRGQANGDKEYCSRGHAYDGPSLYIDPKTGSRHCRLCRRLTHVARVFGLSEAQYLDLNESQDHKCAICLMALEDLADGEVHVDHCHTSGRVRGILCRACNFALGALKDNPESFERAAEYLRRNPA
ncbi:endonuclease VII domain-containing protein [Nonomuraea wenchangensis]